MSYHEGPTHGRPSTAESARRSKQVAVHLEGGPRDGDVITYGQPLPKTLVVHSKGAGWNDYQRKPNTTTYVHEFSTKTAEQEIDEAWYGETTSVRPESNSSQSSCAGTDAEG